MTRTGTAQRPELRKTLLALVVGALLVAAMALMTTANAADEDTQASVYLVFDPETGEFVTVHDTEGDAKAQETQEAIESVADAGDTGAGIAAAPDVSGGGMTAGDTASTNPTLIVGLVVALVVAGAAVVLMRSRA